MSQLTPISVVETALPDLCQNDIRKELTETPQMENVVLLFLLLPKLLFKASISEAASCKVMLTSSILSDKLLTDFVRVLFN